MFLEEQFSQQNLFLFLLLLLKRKRLIQRKKPRAWYVRPLNLPRIADGEFFKLIRNMRTLDEEVHFRYFRMSYERFRILLEKVEPFIFRRNIHRFPISADERLAITIRILATGNSQVSEADSFYVGKSTVNGIFHETCRAIYTALQPEFLPEPTAEDWKEIAKQFDLYWNFPNCVGAIDGKHVIMQAPSNSGSRFFNYKDSFSIVLLAIVDANYLFQVIDVGAYGRQSDGGIFSHSAFGRKLENGSLNIPAPSRLPNSDVTMSHVFVADEAFPLKENLMRPFPGKGLWGCHWKRVFNYRLSRARRIVENAFDILAARWRIFRGPILCNARNTKNIINACVVLHNFLRISDGSTPTVSKYMPPELVDTPEADGTWRKVTENDVGLQPVKHLSGNRASVQAMVIREKFARYFTALSGLVPWQNTMIYGQTEIPTAVGV